MTGRLAPSVLAGVALAALPALAQTGGLPFRDGSGPIEIVVDGSVEWQQKAKTFVARGNARARQDDVTVRADVLTAHYRDSEDGGTEIWQHRGGGRCPHRRAGSRRDRGAGRI